jgi:hypothetical protein
MAETTQSMDAALKIDYLTPRKLKRPEDRAVVDQFSGKSALEQELTKFRQSKFTEKVREQAAQRASASDKPVLTWAAKNRR